MSSGVLHQWNLLLAEKTTSEALSFSKQKDLSIDTEQI